MKNWLLVPLVLALPNPLLAAQDPLALMRENDRRHRVEQELSEVQIHLRSKDGTTKTRDARIAIKQASGADRMRIRFVAPGSVKGTTLLTVEGEDQWLYLPAFKKTRRLGKSELGDRFAETDLSFEDLARREVEHYRYRHLGEAEVDGEACHLIEAEPTEARTVEESPYRRTQIWLRKSDLFVARLRHFDRRDRAWKEIRFEAIKRMPSGVSRPDRIVVTDVQRKHQTVMLVKRRNLESGVPSAWLDANTFHR